MNNYRLGLYEKALPAGLTPEIWFRAAREAGFDFLEISVDETDGRLSRLDWSPSERDGLVKAMRAERVPIATMCLSGHRRFPLGSRSPETRKRSMEILRKAVLLAEDLGIRIIQLAGYDVYYEDGGEDTRKWFSENLAEGVRFAAAHAVQLGFETMETPFMDTVSKAMAYVRAIDSPYLGVYPDLGNLTNACRAYGTRVDDELECGRGHILAMHVKETEEGRYRDMHFGAGKVDFAGGVKKALELGVRLFVAECWHDGAEDWRGFIREVNRFVRAAFDAARGK